MVHCLRPSQHESCLLLCLLGMQPTRCIWYWWFKVHHLRAAKQHALEAAGLQRAASVLPLLWL